MELKQKKIAFISLGCDKNRVDLEEMMFNLSKFGFTFTNSQKADIVIINTCAFILPARKEAIDNILEMIELKKTGTIEKIIVTGCLTEKYLEELKKYLPEVDKFVQVKDNKFIVDIISELYNQKIKFTYENKQFLIQPTHYAYLKISDGCNNACSYCTIPRIRGRFKSKPIPDLVTRAKQLVASGAKEIIIVAQDVTRYGFDIYSEFKLIDLLKELIKIKEIKWIRLHYCYPELVNKNLLDFIANNPKICPYLDIPLQHIDNKILKEMNRKNTEEEARVLINEIKENYPNLLIRSTFIIGFPGETRKQFKKLISFLKDTKLDNVGFFTYSREESTKAFYMKKQIPQFIKNLRLKKIERVQEKIALEKNLTKIGNNVEIIVDSFDPVSGFFEARTNQMSPNIDYYVKIPSTENIKVGNFYNVTLVDFKDCIILFKH